MMLRYLLAVVMSLAMLAGCANNARNDSGALGLFGQQSEQPTSTSVAIRNDFRHAIQSPPSPIPARSSRDAEDGAIEASGGNVFVTVNWVDTSASAGITPSQTGTTSATGTASATQTVTADVGVNLVTQVAGFLRAATEYMNAQRESSADRAGTADLGGDDSASQSTTLPAVPLADTADR